VREQLININFSLTHFSALSYSLIDPILESLLQNCEGSSPNRAEILRGFLSQVAVFFNGAKRPTHALGRRLRDFISRPLDVVGKFGVR